MEDRVKFILSEGKRLWYKMKEIRPLIHHITNFVAMPEQAHATLAIGASPVMALYPEESGDMCSMADALLINIGIPSTEFLSAMRKAMETANKRNIPILLDPVGYGATPYRNYVVDTLLKEYNVSVIKGNSGEIMALAGNSGMVRGVDAVDNIDLDLKKIVRILANKFNAIVIATGEEDIISDGKDVLSVKGGSKMLRNITGSGCMAGSIISAVLGTREDPLVASVAGLIAFKLSAKRAEENSRGPGSFRLRLFDELSLIDGEDIIKEGDVKLWT
ncbi:MAG: hydroxyethylthiazole kinase [bacterium]|nr:hydroxyethylthiazole kinase [bacterium]